MTENTGGFAWRHRYIRWPAFQYTCVYYIYEH